MDIANKHDVLVRQIEKIGEALSVACNLKATCDIVSFSPLIAAQVGQSFAAHAYNPVAVVLIDSVLLRVVALWDKPQEDGSNHTNSFPAVSKLLSDIGVQAELLTRYEARERSEPMINLGGLSAEVLDVTKANFISATKESLMAEFKSITEKIEVVSKGAPYTALFNFRTKHLAHNLELHARRTQGASCVDAENPRTE